MIWIRNKLTGLILPGKFPVMCIWPFILVRPDYNNQDTQTVIRHESIHARQQLEMAWIFFFVWYLLEYFIRLIKIQDRMKAYMELSHEKEAYLNDQDPEYLKKRKPFAWIRYM